MDKEQKKYDIFISYRREGGDKYARTIQQALEKQYRVFLDFDELKDGVFDQRIIDAITESPVFLLILSRGALDRCVNSMTRSRGCQRRYPRSCAVPLDNISSQSYR